MKLLRITLRVSLGFWISYHQLQFKWIKAKSNQFSQRLGFTKWLFQLRPRLYERKECCKYCYYYYLCYCHFQYKYSTASSISNVEPFVTLLKYIGSFKKTSVDSKERKRKQVEKLEDFISYRRKSRCLFMWHVIFQANTGLQLADHN